MTKYKRIGIGLFFVVQALLLAGVAGATADPSLTSATSQATSFFTSNIGTIIAAFLGVAGILWLLALALRSMGIRRRSTVA